MSNDTTSTTAAAGPGLSDQLGAAVIVDGKVVAWFADLDEYAQDFCREQWFGTWLTWRACAPHLVPLTAEEQAECDAAARRMVAAATATDAQCKSERPQDRRPDMACQDQRCGFVGECWISYRRRPLAPNVGAKLTARQR